MGGSDCEFLRDGWLAQPANAWSSGAYLVAAVGVLWRPPMGRRSPAVVAGALALALTFFGSLAYHGPQPAWAGAAHDASIAALLLALVAGGLAATIPPHVPRWPAVAAAAGLVLAAAFLPALVLGPLAAVLAGVEVQRARLRAGPSPARRVAVLALGLALVLYGLGRTGGPLCRPASPIQAHAGWHVLTAVAAAAALFHGDRLDALRRAAGPD